MFVKTHLDAANLKVRTPLKALRIPSYSKMSHESSYIPKSLAQG
jgi:hypothetical protein